MNKKCSIVVECSDVSFVIISGIDIKDVQEMVENHLQEMILKNFDPKKADSIFTDEGEVLIPYGYLDKFLAHCFSCHITSNSGHVNCFDAGLESVVM